MSEPRSAAPRRPRAPTPANIVGALVSVAVAVALFTRYGLADTLSRDESIYTYGGQRLAHGVPPYASIFDPKTPLATTVAGFAAGLARVLGLDGVSAIRVAFCLCACLSVVAVYLLAAHLFRSAVAGLVAGVSLAACRVFAVDALAGPDAKTPGVLFAVLAMLLMARRRWFWAGFAGALAFLVWQPLILYPAVAVLVAVATERGRRVRAMVAAMVGSVVPVAVAAVCFAATGTFSDMLGSVLLYPLEGVERPPETVLDRLGRVVRVVDRYDGRATALFWIGLALLAVLVLARLLRGTPGEPGERGPRWTDPLVAVVASTFLLNLAYACTDFQSYPDLYAFVAYPSIGLAGGTAALLSLARRRTPRLVGVTAVVVALALLTGLSWVWFGTDGRGRTGYPAQQSMGCGLSRMVVPGTPLLALGNPAALVVTGRRNPHRFIFLSAGVDRWKVRETTGGFAGWTAQIQRRAPSVVVVDGWVGRYRARMGAWLRSDGYTVRFLGRWRVFLTDAAVRRARTHGVALTRTRTEFARDPEGRRLPAAEVGDARAAGRARCPARRAPGSASPPVHPARPAPSSPAL